MQHFNVGGPTGLVEAQAAPRWSVAWGPREFGDLVDWEKKLSVSTVSKVLFRDSLGFFTLYVFARSIYNLDLTFVRSFIGYSATAITYFVNPVSKDALPSICDGHQILIEVL